MSETRSWMQRAIDNALTDCHFGREELRDFIRSAKRNIKKAIRTGDNEKLASLQADLAEFEKGLDDCCAYAQRAINLETKIHRRKASRATSRPCPEIMLNNF